MNVRQSVRLVQLQINAMAGEESLGQAKELVGYVMEIDPKALPLHGDMELSNAQMEELGALAARRAKGEPLQYVLGGWDFMGLPFLLEPGVLIPRQDTEVLCEKALGLIGAHGYATVLDLCCGSGCIGISIAKLSNAAVTMTDLSPDCVRLARENAAQNEVEERTAVLEGDLFRPVEGQTFDLICCNPPYLTKADMETLQTEVTYEPPMALYGGPDGLDYYRRIRSDYTRFLNPGGALLLEFGAAQEADIAGLFPAAEIVYDYAGNPRVAVVEER